MTKDQRRHVDRHTHMPPTTTGVVFEKKGRMVMFSFLNSGGAFRPSWPVCFAFLLIAAMISASYERWAMGAGWPAFSLLLHQAEPFAFGLTLTLTLPLPVMLTGPVILTPTPTPTLTPTLAVGRAAADA